jgi:hypothetical protein
MIDEFGEFDGMRVGRETEVLGENLPQCGYDLTWDRTRATAVGGRRLTA